MRKNSQLMSTRDERTEALRAYLNMTPDDLHGENGLTAQQWQAVSLLVAGRRQVDVAQELNVTEETLSRWKALPTFSAALNASVRDAYESNLGTVRESAREALDVLRDLLKSQDEKVRLQAALSVVRLHLDLSQNVTSLPVSPADVARGRLQAAQTQALLDSFI